MVDGTQHLIARPKGSGKQKQNFSAKKKRHKSKHLAALEQSKRVIVLSRAREGNSHDKQLLDEQGLAAQISDEIAIEVDLGFQGCQNEDVNIKIPHSRELSEQQKQEIREQSRSRVKGEHAFAGVKRYNAVAVVYTNRVPDFDDRMMLTATGLWNSYLMAA
jgi:hypothetical protein